MVRLNFCFIRSYICGQCAKNLHHHSVSRFLLVYHWYITKYQDTDGMEEWWRDRRNWGSSTTTTTSSSIREQMATQSNYFHRSSIIVLHVKQESFFMLCWVVRWILFCMIVFVADIESNAWCTTDELFLCFQWCEDLWWSMWLMSIVGDRCLLMVSDLFSLADSTEITTTTTSTTVRNFAYRKQGRFVFVLDICICF